MALWLETEILGDSCPVVIRQRELQTIRLLQAPRDDTAHDLSFINWTNISITLGSVFNLTTVEVSKKFAVRYSSQLGRRNRFLIGWPAIGLGVDIVEVQSSTRTKKVERILAIIVLLFLVAPTAVAVIAEVSSVPLPVVVVVARAPVDRTIPRRSGGGSGCCCWSVVEGINSMSFVLLILSGTTASLRVKSGSACVNEKPKQTHRSSGGNS